MANPVAYFEVGAVENQPLVEFYGQLFGWEMRSVAPGYTIVDTRGGGGIGGGVGRSGSGEPWSTFYVEVEDLQTTLDQAEALGGRTVVPVLELPGMAFAISDRPSSLAKLQKKMAEISAPLTTGRSLRGITSHAAAIRPSAP